MAEITAALVKQLRDKTGAGMMDCKKALTESGGDIDAAVDWLRTKGLAAAAKKAGRVAVEGLVGMLTDGTAGALIEVNSETDFVARNETFQDFVEILTRLALEADGDIETIQPAAYPDTGRKVEEELTHMIATIGENLAIRRAGALAVTKGVVAGYVHGAVKPGLGKIGVLVAVESEGDPEKLAVFGKQLAMHVAATNPQFVDVASVESSVLDRERKVLTNQARESGRPENVIEKMVEGRLRKFYEEVVLLEQVFVIDGKTKVIKAVDEAAKNAGAKIRVTGFERFRIGEGIERTDKDFASEVAAQLA